MVEANLPELPGYGVAQVTRADGDSLDRLYLRCADFLRLTEGRDPAKGDGLALLRTRPPRVPLAHKFVFGIREHEELIGAVDLVRGYPGPLTWYLGLMLLVPEARGRGLGCAICSALALWVHGQGGRHIRLAVQQQNEAALRFWQRQGFAIIGSGEQRIGERTNHVLRLELALPAGRTP